MDRNYANLLFDYYGNLLTDHQKEIYESYYKDDLSMNEIAETYNISKAAVSDLINRTSSLLEEYELKIKYIEQTRKIESLINDYNESNNLEIKKIINKLEKIIRS